MGKRFSVQTPVLDDEGEIVGFGDVEEWVNTANVGDFHDDFMLIERVA